MKIATAAAIFLAGLIPCSAAFSADPAQAPAQPFAHPADDAAYKKDLQQDEMQAEGKAPDSNPSRNGQVRFTSGGIADSGMTAMQEQEKNYNLKLLFVSEPDGEYLADVAVTITDGKGASLLDTSTQGPVLLVSLPPGHYTVTAVRHSGGTLTRKVEGGKGKLSSYTFRFPANG